MIGLFGGTFDPFHKAHRALLECALDQLGLDRLLVMPVGRPPHKDRQTSFAAFRYEMASLGTRGLAGLEVSDWEIRKPGIDYSYHTVMGIKEETGEDRILLLGGSDILLSIDDWYRPADLLKEAGLAIAVRGGDRVDRILDKAREVQKTYATTVILFDMPAQDLSASQLRDRLASGRSIEGMCPPPVERFIRRRRIYDFSDLFAPLGQQGWQELLDLEERAWPLQTQERRLHAASVAQYAGLLGSACGLDLSLAGQAGLLHDLAKGFSLDRQRDLAGRYLDLAGYGAHAKENFMAESLAHGPASAYLAMELLGQGPSPVTEAIAFHSTASPSLSPLGEVLFLADKIAYDRPFKNLDPIRALARQGQMVPAMRLCLEEVFSALKRRNEAPSPFSTEAYDHYRSLGED